MKLLLLQHRIGKVCYCAWEWALKAPTEKLNKPIFFLIDFCFTNIEVPPDISINLSYLGR